MSIPEAGIMIFVGIFLVVYTKPRKLKKKKKRESKKCQ